MAPRAYWKGWLKLDAISCPVRLYAAATQASRITFHEINRDTGHRINLRPHDPETGEEVPKEQIVRGYEFEKGRYVLVEEDEVEALRVTPDKTIDIQEFVPAAELDHAYIEKPYFLAPDGPRGADAYRVLREAMARSGKVAIGRVVLSRADHGVALMPRGRGMLMTTLRPPLEMRAAPAETERDEEEEEQPVRGRRRRAAAADRKEKTAALDPEMVDLAGLIMDRREGHFDPTHFEDRYQIALRRLVEAKLKGESFELPEAPEPEKVVDLKAMLRRALAAEGGGAEAKPRASKKAAARRGAERPRDRRAANR
ncbi:MAG TPA: Ku protein [Stellaceae bacterium]|nr:Ku protein [Stellaceae bacterium]